MSFSVIILAAGKGTRMRSAMPKVLQLLAGKPLLQHVLDTVQTLNPQQTVVVCGYKGKDLQENCQSFQVDWAWQEQQLGTGHAVQSAYPSLKQTDKVLVLYGDVPLIRVQTLAQLLDITPNNAVGILTAKLQDPYGFGRIIRDEENKIVAVVEEKDATVQQKQINEINSGIYVLPYKSLQKWLANLQTNNQQQEYYLTDIIAMAANEHIDIVAHQAEELEVFGINSQQQLASIERGYQLSLAEELMSKGVKLYDPARIDIRGVVEVGEDVVIDVNVIFEGKVVIGDGVNICANVIIKDSCIGRGAVIEPHTIIDSAVIGEQAHVGPFARIRPGTELKNHAKIGNFVEIKNSTIGHGSKVNHLSYIGDTQMGSKVNIGAGVITCNYDGAAKHKTIIEDEAFIGSNCELIAPVTVGKKATLAAGTTLTKDAPAGGLTLTKKVIENILSWQRPSKNKEEK